MKTYHVPVNVSISSHITVKAKNPEEAIKKARKAYKGYQELGGACVYVDFCEDANDVEEDDET